jgi:hypothetical protein
VDSIRHVGGVLQAVDQDGDEHLDVPVADDVHALGHGLDGGVLDGGARVAHRVGDLGHDLGQAHGHLARRAVGQGAEQLAGALLGLPLLGAHGLKERGQHGGDAVGAQQRLERGLRALGGGAHRRDLVGQRGQHGAEQRHQVGLGGAADALRDGGDGQQRALARAGVLGIDVALELGEGAGADQGRDAGGLDGGGELAGGGGAVTCVWFGPGSNRVVGGRDRARVDCMAAGSRVLYLFDLQGSGQHSTMERRRLHAFTKVDCRRLPR